MIYLGSDHGGYTLKEEIKRYLSEKEILNEDCGTNSNDRCDYPIYAENVVKNVKNGDLGILICKTGNGMAITANKFKNIRAAICLNEEMAELAKVHNDANVLVIPAKYVTEELAVRIVRMFLAKNIEDETHKERVKMIKEIENMNMK